MFQRSVRVLLVALVALGLTTSLSGAAYADYQPPMALLGDGGTPIPLKNAAMIERTDGGFRYIAGQQNSHLTITLVNGKLLYSDTGTQELRDIPRACSQQAASKGIAVLCRIPTVFADAGEMYLEVWPRLGDDYIDGSTLPAMFRMWVLADAGADTVKTGAGADFVNGAQNNDQVWGGSGDDWIRTGIGDDTLYGEGGNDKLVGVDDNDTIYGGDGNDHVYGGNGSDHLYGGTGPDTVSCGGGYDVAEADSTDHRVDCESLV